MQKHADNHDASFAGAHRLVELVLQQFGASSNEPVPEDLQCGTPLHLAQDGQTEF